MARTLSLEEFLSLLPIPSTHLPAASAHAAAITSHVPADAAFVSPTLHETTLHPTENPSLLIVSAPGAVGKSTIARAVAHQTNGILCDLSAEHVGSHTYVGLLSAAFGSDFPAIQEEIAGGKRLVVLDALDEAELRAGPRNFEAFVQDILEAARAPRTKPSFVTLARTETADDLELYLEYEGVAYSRFEIDFFDRASAELFLERQLDLRPTSVHRQHYAPYSEVRDALFALLFEAVREDDGAPMSWNDPAARSFLGYAPVLQAVAAYLDHDNYHDLRKAIVSQRGSNQSGISTSTVWSLLADIVRQILERERQKVSQALKSQLALVATQVGWNNWDSLYMEDEQCARLAALVFSDGPPEPPISLPRPLQAQYERDVKAALNQHPLLGAKHDQFANVVFRDFVLAQALTCEDALRLRQARGHLHKVEYLPSPLMGRIFVEMSSTSEDGYLRIEAADLAFIYESFKAGANGDNQPWLGVYQYDESDPLLALIDVDRSDDPLLFEVIGDNRTLPFSGRLSNALVTTQSEVSLGRSGGEFSLGPDVEVTAKALRIRAAGVRVLTSREPSPNVTLQCQEYIQEQWPLTVTVYGEGELNSSWPEISHPWIRYSTEPVTGVGREATGASELTILSKQLTGLLRLFHGAHGGLSRSVRLIDNIGVGNRPRVRSLRDFLTDQRILVKDGGLYRLNLEELQRLGISWQTVRSREVGPTRPLLEAFMNWESRGGRRLDG